MKRATGYYWVFTRGSWHIGHYSEAEKNWILPRFNNEAFVDSDMNEVDETLIGKMRKILILGNDENGKAITHVYRDKKTKKPLIEKATEFVEWLAKLRQVAADKLNIEPSEVKINDDEAFKYFNDGFTPTQCFREAW